MRIHRTSVELTRDDNGPAPKKKRTTPPKVVLHAKPRPDRGRARVNRDLVNRGDVEFWVDPRLFNKARDTGRGLPYHDGVIILACTVGALFGLALRQTEGFCRMFSRIHGGGRPPSYSTICRRRRSITFDPPRVRAGCVLAIDGTGITCFSPGEWIKAKHKDQRHATFVKLHVGVDQVTGEVLSWEVTSSSGRGSGDVSVGPVLIDQAARRGRVTAVLADRADDAKSCYQAAQDAGGRLITPPKKNAKRGLHPHRDDHIAQIGKLGPPGWKKAVGYGQRSQVEGFFACHKRIWGGHVRARTLDGARAETGAQIFVWNLWHTNH